NRRDGHFALPVCIGEVESNQSHTSPNEYDKIIRYIAQTRTPYYQSDVENDQLLISADIDQPLSIQFHSPQDYHIRTRKKILSFAGAPLMARGKLLGVLCVIY